MTEVPHARTHEDVRCALAEQIGSGRLRPGQRLGAERALAAEFGVSRATLRQALAVLADGGVVRRVPGRGGGTFVAKGKIVRLSAGATPAKLARVLALLRPPELVMAMTKLRARRTPSNQAHVTNRLDDPLLLAADAAPRRRSASARSRPPCRCSATRRATRWPA